MIVLARHGQSLSNAEGLLVGRSDPPLTALGERQARALAPLVGSVAAAWTSPLSRARRTAELAAPGVTAEVREAFVEVDYGDLEGRSLASLSAEEWRALEADHSTRFGGAESLESVDARVRDELDALLADRSSLLHDLDSNLLIVSHASPIKSALVWALGVAGATVWRTRIDTGSLTTIGARRGAPLLVNFNVVPRLT